MLHTFWTFGLWRLKCRHLPEMLPYLPESSLLISLTALLDNIDMATLSIVRKLDLKKEMLGQNAKVLEIFYLGLKCVTFRLRNLTEKLHVCRLGNLKLLLWTGGLREGWSLQVMGYSQMLTAVWKIHHLCKKCWVVKTYAFCSYWQSFFMYHHYIVYGTPWKSFSLSA